MIFTTVSNEKIAVNPANILFVKTDVRHYRDVIRHNISDPAAPDSEVIEKDYYQIVVIFIDGKSMSFEWESKERRDQLFDELNYLMDRGDVK